MTRAKEVSEKSLELNVCTEILQCLRANPIYKKALWVGLTQREERKRGIDARIHNAHGSALMLQFKAPWVTSRVDYLYKFSINKKQHQALEQLELNHPNAVFYVFPLYSRCWKADRDVPHLLQDTWLLPVSCIQSKYFVKENTTVEVRRDFFSQISVRGKSSWEATCDGINARDYFESLGRTLDRTPDGMELRSLEDWIKSPAIALLRFKGLGFFYLPL